MRPFLTFCNIMNPILQKAVPNTSLILSVRIPLYCNYMCPADCKEMGIVTTNVFHPLHKPIEFLPSSTEIHCCPPVLLSVLLSKVNGKTQGVGCFRGPAHEEKRAAIF